MMGINIDPIKKFYKCHIKPWRDSLITLVVSFIVGFSFGTIVSRKISLDFYKDDKLLLLILSIIILIIVLAYLYYKKQCDKYGEDIDINATKFKYIFYAFSFFMYTLYYYSQKNYFLSSYKLNKFGIAQEQYVFLVNFIGFFIIVTVIFAVIFKDFSIKKIGTNGIEFEKEKIVAGKQNTLVHQYKSMIDLFSNNLCEIDNLMSQLNQQNLIRDDYTLPEFIILLDSCLDPFVSQNPEISIIIEPFQTFDDFAKNELSYNPFVLKKIKANMIDNNVYTYENKIFVKYYISLLSDTIMVIIDCDKTYPLGLGTLVYSYLVALETSYSKHLETISNT